MHSVFPEITVQENKPPEGYSRTSNGNYKNTASGTVIKYPKLGAFEVVFNNKLIFSKNKSRNWPESGQVVDLVEKEINRVQNCIPEDDKMSQSFIRKRSTKNTEEFSKRPQSSNDQSKRAKDQRGSNKSLQNNYPNTNNHNNQLHYSKEKKTEESQMETSAKNLASQENSPVKDTFDSLEFKNQDQVEHDSSVKKEKKEKQPKHQKHEQKLSGVNNNHSPGQYPEQLSNKKKNPNNTAQPQPTNSNTNMNKKRQVSDEQDDQFNKASNEVQYEDFLDPNQNELVVEQTKNRPLSAQRPSDISRNKGSANLHPQKQLSSVKEQYNDNFENDNDDDTHNNDNDNDNDDEIIQEDDDQNSSRQMQKQDEEQEPEQINDHLQKDHNEEEASQDMQEESEENKYFQVDEYKIKSKLGKQVSKKIPFTNEEDSPMEYQLLSSDEELMQVKTESMLLQPGEKGHFKIKVLSQDSESEETVYLLIHDNVGNKLCVVLNLIFEA